MSKISSGEESGSFSSAKTQDLLVLGMKIQKSENSWIEEMIEKNPRILCTSSDGPTILQEGARYNALHIAARWGNTDATALILRIVSSKSFMAKLYPDDEENIRNDRTRYLADLYLNTPDKGTLDTPLHFACKFNCYGVAKLLTSHPLCDLNIKNRENQTAEDIIGTRATKNKELSSKIRELFHNNKIVPIWRDPSQTQPVVGLPVNPKHLGIFTPLPFYEQFKGIDLNLLYGPVDQTLIPPAVLGIPKVIKAYAGPMDALKAEQFFNMLKQSGKGALSRSLSHEVTFTSPSSPLMWSNTPPKISNALKSVFPSPKLINVTSPTSPLCSSTPICQSPGIESTLSSRYSISIGPFSPNRSVPCLQVIQDKTIRLGDPDKGIERVGRKYAKELKIQFLEYWKFADKFLDLASLEGLVHLEDHLSEVETEIENGELVQVEVESPLSYVCHALKELQLGTGYTPNKLNTFDYWKDDWRVRLHQNLGFKYAPISATSSDRNKVELGNVNVGKVTSSPEKSTRQINFNARKLSMGAKDFEGCEYTSQDSSNDSFDLERYSSSDDSLNMIHERGSPLLKKRQRRSEEGFFTARTSPVRDLGDQFEDCMTYNVFLTGTKQCKEDYQALNAIASVVDNLPGDKFPAILRWYNSLKALGNCDKKLKSSSI